MDKIKSERGPIPEFETLEDIAEFWDTHSTADYDGMTHEVHFEVSLNQPDKVASVSLLPELSKSVVVGKRRSKKSE